MPRIVRFQGRSLAVIDWHCPGNEVGAGREEESSDYEVSIGRVGGHVCRFPDGEVAADTAGLLMVNAGEPFRPIHTLDHNRICLSIPHVEAGSGLHPVNGYA